MLINWAACGAALFIKWVSFFCRGGGGGGGEGFFGGWGWGGGVGAGRVYFWEVVVGVHRPRHLIFTLFHSNTVWHKMFAVFAIFPAIRKNKFRQIKITVNIFPAKIYSRVNILRSL